MAKSLLRDEEYLATRRERKKMAATSNFCNTYDLKMTAYSKIEVRRVRTFLYKLAKFVIELQTKKHVRPPDDNFSNYVRNDVSLYKYSIKV